MSFASWAFAAFLPIVVGVHRLLRGRQRIYFLLAASYVFYGAWDFRFLSLIVISTLTDFWVSRGMERSSKVQRRRLLWISLAVNLGVLGFFKYWGFFVESAGALLARVGLEPNLPVLRVILPVGISFYTFQTLAYTIDVYRGRIPASNDLAVFGLFVAYFPQLVAGPIERAERLLPQLADTNRVGSRDDLAAGAWLVGRGLFRKIAIADGVAPFVQTAFADPSAQGRLGLIVGAIGFAIQIYGDFAGYTDIARGSARLMGVTLVENFRQPYAARSITEFWRRWHMSLSAWLRDYLYIPLGGNRLGRRRTYVNLMVTMLLGGLWHGAAWTFVLWGALHGVYLAVERWIGRDRIARRGPLWVPITATLVTLTWIPFRAPDISAAGTYVSGLLASSGGSVSASAFSVVLLAALLTVFVDRGEARRGEMNPMTARSPVAAGVVYGGMALAAFVLGSGVDAPFIYFQF